MTEIKDKVVTVESLSTLHEHNKESYMSKSDPIGTGSLSINRRSNSVVGMGSMAVGYNTAASGNYSSAKGYSTAASGANSSAEGNLTIATGSNQHVQGKYNIEDTENKYAHIVGNGTNSSSRSNAHTVDWDGNAWFAGDVYVGGTSQDDGTKLVKSTNVVSVEYGDTLPTAGTVGRVFFKRLTE